MPPNLWYPGHVLVFRSSMGLTATTWATCNFSRYVGDDANKIQKNPRRFQAVSIALTSAMTWLTGGTVAFPRTHFGCEHNDKPRMDRSSSCSLVTLEARLLFDLNTLWTSNEERQRMAKAWKAVVMGQSPAFQYFHRSDMFPRNYRSLCH